MPKDPNIVTKDGRRYSVEEPITTGDQNMMFAFYKARRKAERQEPRKEAIGEQDSNGAMKMDGHKGILSWKIERPQEKSDRRDASLDPAAIKSALQELGLINQQIKNTTPKENKRNGCRF
ncbi:MAG: hypothetical protein SFT68_03020 [Rickettsiaceae bacterium]|nr:hypothetical protein [Rickettsiaceae bacterium]